MGNTQPTLDDDDDRPDNGVIELAKSEVLKAVAYALLRQVYGVTELQMPDIKQSINFNDEVRRFEVNLIKQALIYTNGNQRAAARLMNMNATTLHTKIKLYRIEMPAFGYVGESFPHNGAHPHADD
ncbi:MAG: hypothetical protein H7Z38_22350 [Rubrivivax sp.]|nr:hypothetical protein [Pyrinomonadaceae bacterium]